MTVEFHWLKTSRVVEGSVSGTISVEALREGVELLLSLLNTATSDEEIHLLVRKVRCLCTAFAERHSAVCR